MSLILNGTTIKQPSSVSRIPIEVDKSHITLDGVSKRDIVRQKETFVMTFTLLSISQVNDILAVYNLKTPVSMVFSDLSVSTSVWVRIQSRNYDARGTDYRETIVLSLEEV